jgi:hypothetical protein
MTRLMTTAEMNEQTGWTPKQRNHLSRLIKSGATIAYVCTDRHGRPSNGGPATRAWQVRPGLVQRIAGPSVASTVRAATTPHPTSHRPWRPCGYPGCCPAHCDECDGEGLVLTASSGRSYRPRY